MIGPRSVVVIGNFDGVHPGHAAVLERARAIGGDRPLIVLTFWPHPASVVRPGAGPRLLTRLQQRIDLLTQAGADEVRVIDFTAELSRQSPAQFVADYLAPLDPAYVVVGENFRFGRQAAGDVATRRVLAAGRCEVVGLPLVHRGDEETCSTAVRKALERGEVRHAGELLGRPFRFIGTVVHGDHRGRELGFPTANLPVPDELACPADGVYAGYLTRLDGRDESGAILAAAREPQAWPAAISVGTNPTFNGIDSRVESYVIDAIGLDLYGVEVAVDFRERIRGQVRFTGIPDLVAQMRTDVNQALTLLAEADEHP
ncbi:MAG: bifunctional riboflavin kinase/FAD synthetase [Propioniciclava sp.]